MRYGMNMLLWTALVDEEHLPIMEAIKKTGFDGVELPVFLGAPSHYEKLARQLDDIGLARTCATAIGDPEANPISSDAAQRQAGFDFLKSNIDNAQALGAELLCGPFFQPLGHFTGKGPTAEEKERAVAFHVQIADYAAQANLQLAVEPLNRFECYFMNIAADAAENVRQVNRPNFGVLFDTFHANIEEKNPAAALESIASSVSHIHICENDRGTPGSGNVDWTGVFGALRRMDYDNWLVIEAFGRALPDLAAATRVWRDFFSSREEVYTEGLRFMQEQWQVAGAN